MANLQASELRFEHHPTGLGVQVTSPRLSWKVRPSGGSIPQDWKQVSYEVDVKRTGSSKTFQATGSDTILVPWPDEPLASGEAAQVRVRSSSSTDPTEWSDWATVEAALLLRSDWAAQCITAPPRTEERDIPTRMESGLFASGRYSSFQPTRAARDYTSPLWGYMRRT